MISDQLTLVKQRKNFYRDNYHRMCSALLGALILMFVLCFFVIYLFIQQPLPDFYATSMNGNLSHLTPLSAPNYSSKPLIE